MGVFFFDPKSNEDYKYKFDRCQINDDDVLLSFSYLDHDHYKINYFAFTFSSFQKFHSFLLDLDKKNEINLKGKIEAVRVTIHDAYHDHTDDFQLIELLSLKKENNKYILNYRYLGQLIEHNVVESLITYYLNNPDPTIEEISSFVEYTEKKEQKIKFKNGFDFSSELLKFNDDTGEYEYNKRLGLKRILGFEKNDYTSDDFEFRKYSKIIINNIVQLIFDSEDIEKIKKSMESILIDLSV